MDDPVLRKLKLTQAPKAEVITEYDENGIGVAMHMFDEIGKYQGVFDYKKWAEGDKLDKFLNRFETHERYLVKKHIDVDKRKETFVELQKLGFSISEREFNKMNYMVGEGLRIGLALQPFTTKAFGFVGTRYLKLDEYLDNDGLPDIFFHQTYIFDYTGKLKKIYNYDEMGEYLKIFEGGKSGISEYRNSDWGPEPILNRYRYHNFENDNYFDFNPHDIFEIFKTYPYSAEIYFIDIKESKINIVYSIDDNESSFINLVIDVNQKFGYYKTFKFPGYKSLTWKFMTKPDGSKIDLSEYEIIKF
ncbi:MAG: hypothetical protein IPM42_04635 [Saprospiraceae bacterium]|nr:hypothetical protein [Saprospiraceae bacterium]